MQQQILILNPGNASPINKEIFVTRDEDKWVYFHFGRPIYSHAAGYCREFYLVLSQLIDNGLCRECEVLKAFDVPKRTLNNWRAKYAEEGAAAFFLTPRRRKGGTILTPEVLADVQSLFNEGNSYSDVSGQLEIKECTLRKAVQDGRLTGPRRRSGLDKSERTVLDAQAAAGMGTACTRVDERVLASLGKLSGGVATSFERSLSVPSGGVLCALPALLANGLLEGARQCLGAIHGYYTQFQILLLLGFMALCRVKNVAQLGGRAPGELGILIGTDRSPEEHCLRRKMDDMAGHGRAKVWAAHLSSHWMEQNPDSCGYLYADGHVSVYHGSQTKLPRRYVSRERLCMRGISNYWVNDALGRPFFSVERQIDEGLLATLRDDIIPRLLADVPGQPTDEELEDNPHLCRFAIVHDREGYSPGFAWEIWVKHRISFLTYHKFPGKDWPEEWFEEHEVRLAHGETVRMRLAEMGTLVGSDKKKYWFREMRRLTESGHQTSIISTVFEPPMAELAPKMFARWCQENFFGYMKQHFMFDAFAEYGTESFTGTGRVVNPAWRELEKKRGALTTKLRYRRAKFAEMTLNPEEDSKKFVKWELRMAELHGEIEYYEKTIDEIKEQKKQIDKHLTWTELPEEHRFIRLSTSRKNLADTIKMIAYRAETAMAELVADAPRITMAEARAILRNLFNNEADIIPDNDAGTLRVVIHGAANPVTDRTLLELLELLNQTETIYPGTNLTMIFESATSKIKS